MELANVVAYRWIVGQDSGYETVSGVLQQTGYLFQQNGGNPVSGPEPASANARVKYCGRGGRMEYVVHCARDRRARICICRTESRSIRCTRVIRGGAVSASGNRDVREMPRSQSVNRAAWAVGDHDVVPERSSRINWCPSPDGAETNPVTSSATGWWNRSAVRVGYSTAWRKTAVNANTSWTIEVAALNEAGVGSSAEAAAGDWRVEPGGCDGDVADGGEPGGGNEFDGVGDDAVEGVGGGECVDIPDCDCGPVWGGAAGLHVYGADLVCEWRVAGDAERGGRPDHDQWNGISDGQQGVDQWRGGDGGELDATQIVATAPSMATAGASSGTAVDVEVLDATTGGETDIAAALTYNQGTKDVVALVSAPASLETSVMWRLHHLRCGCMGPMG